MSRYVRVGLLASMELPPDDGHTAASKTPETDARTLTENTAKRQSAFGRRAEISIKNYMS